MSKLYFCKCTHFLLFLSLSTLFIYHFHSYTKILTLSPLIPTPNFSHFHPDSPHSHPCSPRSHPDSLHFHPYSPLSHPDSLHSHHSHPDSLHSHNSYPDSPHSHHSPHSVPRFPILAFADSQSLKPNNNKRGVVGTYIREFLVTCQVKLNHLNEYIIFELCVRNKKGYMVSLYRSSIRHMVNLAICYLTLSNSYVILML